MIVVLLQFLECTFVLIYFSLQITSEVPVYKYDRYVVLTDICHSNVYSYLVQIWAELHADHAHRGLQSVLHRSGGALP